MPISLFMRLKAYLSADIEAAVNAEGREGSIGIIGYVTGHICQ